MKLTIVFQIQPGTGALALYDDATPRINAKTCPSIQAQLTTSWTVKKRSHAIRQNNRNSMCFFKWIYTVQQAIRTGMTTYILLSSYDVYMTGYDPYQQGGKSRCVYDVCLNLIPWF